MKNCEWIQPLGERHLKTPYSLNSSFARSLSIISPELVYYYLSQFVTFSAATMIGTGQYGTTASSFFNEHSLIIAVTIRIMAVTLAVLPLLISFKHEYPVLLPKSNKTSRIAITILCGMMISMFFNVLAMRTGFSESSSSFSQTSSAQFSLPIWLGIIVYGLITPLTEEIVHRGLIYNRLRRYFNLPIAIITCSLIFGVSHGNIVQLVYAFIMGIFICYIYERYGAFLYPVLFHCSANITIYVCMSIAPVKAVITSVPALIAEGILSCICVALIARDNNISAKEQ